jgi:hypothetical protein
LRDQSDAPEEKHVSWANNLVSVAVVPKHKSDKNVSRFVAPRKKEKFADIDFEESDTSTTDNTTSNKSLKFVNKLKKKKKNKVQFPTEPVEVKKPKKMRRFINKVRSKRRPLSQNLSKIYGKNNIKIA